MNISRFVTALCAALVCQAAVGQAENNNVPVDDWPDEAVELAAALPDRYSGDLSIAETIEQAIAHLPADYTEFEVSFIVPVVKDSEALVDESVLEGLPTEQRNELLKEYGFTQEEIDDSRVDIEIAPPPVSLEEFLHDTDNDISKFPAHVEQQLEWLLNQNPNNSLEGQKQKGNQLAALSCGGFPIGSTRVEHVQNCVASVKNTYMCQEYSIDGQARADWILIDSQYIPRDVDEICNY